MPNPDSIAGPSRPYFPIPFRLDAARASPAPPRPFGQLSSRSSTPIRPLARARSSSTYSVRTQADEDAALLDRKRADSVKKMVSSWDLLADKYGAIGLNEDDEIDIRTGDILKNRGRLKKMEPRRDIGEDSDGDTEEQTVVSEQGEEVDSDEDELGGEDSLDPQTRQAPPQRAWTDQDREDLKAFLRAEEARKELGVDEDDGEEQWTSDEDGIQADISRTTSPVGSDDEGFSADGDESEDELLAFDEEASKKTPVPPKPRQDCLQVVIPSWPRPAAKAGPSRATTPKRAKPAQTLRNLFTPPPSATQAASDLFSPIEPSTTSSRVKSVKALDRQPSSATTATSSLSAKQKGKARMPSERPHETPETNPEDLDPPSDTEYYLPALRLHSNGMHYRACPVCRTCPDDPIRRQYAYFCKGRGMGSKYCLIAKAQREEVRSSRRVRDGETRKEEVQVGMRGSKSEGDLRGLSEGLVLKPRQRISAAQMALLQESSEEEAGPPTARVRELKEKRSSRKVTSQPTSPNQPSNKPPATTPEITPPRLPSNAKLPQSQSTDSDTDSWMFQVLETLPREMRGLSNEPLDLPRRPKKRAVTLPAEASGEETDASMKVSGSRVGIVRYCSLCRSAGGKREEEATECKGRNWVKRCPYYVAEGTTPAQPTQEVQAVVPTPQAQAVPLLSPSPDPPAQPRSLKKSARKRIITPISVSPAPDVFGTTTVQSPPPSSPPPSSPPSRVTQYVHPTPSPTVSAEPDKREAPHTLLWPPTSPLARRILPLPRGSHYAIQPTPPPSTVSRTSSISSDRAAFDRPRSILRAPPSAGSDSGSAPTSLKRARFSLRPRSPAADASEFGQSDTEDEHESQASTSPWQGGEGQGTSSPFFSKEFSVRAADVGFQLGLGHTGRITPGMIQALFPKPDAVDTPSPDSTRSTPTYKPYTLPTPPRVSSTPSRAARSPSKATAGLMLPPPVPPKRLGSANSNTPGPSTPSSAIVTPAKSPRTPTPRRAVLPPVKVEEDTKPIIFRTALPPSVVAAQNQARARSRSMSVMPTKRAGDGGGSSMTRKAAVPATTPRKRHRDRAERELARLARELGDEAGLEWGMDEDVGQEIAREGREGTVFMYVE